MSALTGQETELGKRVPKPSRKQKENLGLPLDTSSPTASPTTPRTTVLESLTSLAIAPSSAERAARTPTIKRPSPTDTKMSSETRTAPSFVNYNGRFIKLPDLNDPELIYDWGVAKPPLDPTSGSFLPLSDRQRQWKSNCDEVMKPFIGVVAPLDEWEFFSGPFDLVPPVFVTRAKRAFWTGKSWEQYERQELQAYSPDDELPKNVRLGVFQKLKVRLCEEIWLQPYPERPLDSKIPTPEADETDNGPQHSTYFAPRPFKRQRTEEARPSPTGWAADSQGEMQPLYEDETEPPSMDRHLAAFRRDRNHIVDQLQRNGRNGRDLAEQVALAHVGGVTVSGRPAETPSFEESCEQTERDMQTSDEGE